MSDALLGRTAIRAKQIGPGEAFASAVAAGQLVQIVDLGGKQVAEFVAFAGTDASEWLSTGQTRAANNSIVLQRAMTLWSNRQRAMFELVTDTVGRHDMLVSGCSAKPGKPGGTVAASGPCRDALTAALGDEGVGGEGLPDPINWFMNVALVQRGAFEVREPLSERNDQVVLRALTDTVVAVAACPTGKAAPATAKVKASPGAPASGNILVRVYR